MAAVSTQKTGASTPNNTMQTSNMAKGQSKTEEAKSDPAELIQKLVTKYPYLKDELNRLSTMFTVREARFKERLHENEGRVFDFGYQLACEKPKVERQAAELAEEKKKREEMESSLANEKKAHAATLKALSAGQRSESPSSAAARLQDVKKLNIINNILRPQIHELTKKEDDLKGENKSLVAKKEWQYLGKIVKLERQVNNLEGEKESLAGDFETVMKKGEEIKSRMVTMIQEWDREASVIPMKRSRDAADISGGRVSVTKTDYPSPQVKVSGGEDTLQNQAAITVDSDPEDDMPLAKRLAATRGK